MSTTAALTEPATITPTDDSVGNDWGVVFNSGKQTWYDGHKESPVKHHYFTIIV